MRVPLNNGSEYNGADRIMDERREAEIDRLTANHLGDLSCDQLAELLDQLADRLFCKGHMNRYLIEEAAVRIRDY